MVWVSRFASFAEFWIVGIAIYYPSLHDPCGDAQLAVRPYPFIYNIYSHKANKYPVSRMLLLKDVLIILQSIKI